MSKFTQFARDLAAGFEAVGRVFDNWQPPVAVVIVPDITALGGDLEAELDAATDRAGMTGLVVILIQTTNVVKEQSNE